MSESIPQLLEWISKNKKIVVVISVIMIVGIILIIRSINKETRKEATTSTPTTMVTPQLATKEKIFEPFVQKGKVIYLSNYPDIQKEFYFYQLDLSKPDAERVKILDDGFMGIESVQYSSDGNKAFLIYTWPVNTIPQKVVVDFQSRQQYKLNKNISDLVFLEQQDKIIYTYLNTDKVQLNIASIDGSNWQTLKDLGYDPSGYDLVNIDDGNIAYVKRSSRDKILPLYKFNLQEKKEEIIYQDASIENPIFSPDKNKVLAGFYLEGSTVPQIGVLDLTNKERKLFDELKLDINTTLWSNNNQLIMSSFDSNTNQKYLVLYDTSNNQKKTLEIKTEDNYSPLSNLTINNGYLFFASGQNLYKIPLGGLGVENQS